LIQNYPNPFNPLTEIKYNLPVASRVILNIYNIIGQQVENLVNRNVEAGYHSITFNGRNLPSGTYIYRLQADTFVQTKKMILIK
jgi:flagellar hook assembly protein FlgD